MACPLTRTPRGTLLMDFGIAHRLRWRREVWGARPRWWVGVRARGDAHPKVAHRLCNCSGGAACESPQATTSLATHGVFPPTPGNAGSPSAVTKTRSRNPPRFWSPVSEAPPDASRSTWHGAWCNLLARVTPFFVAIHLLGIFSLGELSQNTRREVCQVQHSVWRDAR